MTETESSTDAASTPDPEPAGPPPATSRKISSYTLQGHIMLPFILLALGAWVGGVLLLQSSAAPSFSIGYITLMLGLTALYLSTLVPRTTATAGADGVHLRWLGRGRFIPYSEIESIACTQSWLWVNMRMGNPAYYFELKLRSGKTLALPGQHEHLAALANAAAAYHKRYQRAEPPAAVPAIEATGGSAKSRLEQLRSVGAGAHAAPRVAPIRRDDLWNVVDSVSSTEAQRAAAAITLSSGALDQQEKARLRIAAESTADPRLRFVFDSARGEAAPDDEALAEVLAELDAAGKTPRATQP